MSGGYQAASTTMLSNSPATGSYSGTFTAVDTVDGSGNGTIGTLSGASPATDSNAKTIDSCFDVYVTFIYTSTLLNVSGFSSDPGISYFTTAVISGASRSSASASYGYSAGVATWTWGAGAILTAGAGKTLAYS